MRILLSGIGAAIGAALSSVLTPGMDPGRIYGPRVTSSKDLGKSNGLIWFRVPTEDRTEFSIQAGKKVHRTIKRMSARNAGKVYPSQGRAS
jgi:hypothetical protein